MARLRSSPEIWPGVPGQMGLAHPYKASTWDRSQRARMRSRRMRMRSLAVRSPTPPDPRPLGAPALRRPGAVGLCEQVRSSLAAHLPGGGLCGSQASEASLSSRGLSHGARDGKTEEFPRSASGEQASLFGGGLDLGSALLPRNSQPAAWPLPPLPRPGWAAGWTLARPCSHKNKPTPVFALSRKFAGGKTEYALTWPKFCRAVNNFKMGTRCEDTFVISKCPVKASTAEEASVTRPTSSPPG
ncbi:uncharacterized protein LOC118883362 [Balaenoptera musculus]|uniref:Uncharacterized protein LOC118883362 n=1 Tax=Balaenoptera musculus TaxID=9771 RepID=A0A8B8VM71_BALMU|nr:uncharacterized protein LOC118883362 [Balaenoptera musculus]